MRYTPGPWTAERDPCHFDTLSSIGAGKGALCIEVGGKAGVVEQEANTRLIAAAPCLLAALQSLVGPRQSAALGDRIDAANAAIAKATGQ